MMGLKTSTILVENGMERGLLSRDIFYPKIEKQRRYPLSHLQLLTLADF